MRIAKPALYAALAAALLLNVDGALAKKKPAKPSGPSLVIYNCTSQHVRVQVSEVGKEIEKDLPGEKKAYFPINPGDRPLIQIKTKSLTKWKRIFALKLGVLSGEQSEYGYRWTGETIDYGQQGC